MRLRVGMKASASFAARTVAAAGTARRIVLRCAWAGVGLGLACATNPVTGKSEFNLMSESQEISLGRESDPQIVATYGLYDDARLAAYVDSVGQRLVAISHRPNLHFTFRVLDSPVINAFALPGGYVYVTRGILAHMNDEAELAIVLGHEIGHVTARHGAHQYSRSTLAGLGIGLGSVLSEDVARFSPLAQTALGLMFLKYGRGDETQADELGVGYAARAGWDPERGVDFFEVLDRQQQESGQSLPGWLSTHPAPADRVARTRQLAATTKSSGQVPTPAGGFRTGEAAHKARLEGVVFGDNPRQGFFDGSTFKHPDEGFVLQFPSGWATRNTPAAVLAVEPQKQARFQLTLEDAKGQSPTQYVRALATSAGAELLAVRAETIGGWNAAVAELRVTGESGPVILQLTAIQRRSGEGVFQILGAGGGSFATWQPTFLKCMRSFAPLRERAALDIQPNRVRIVRLQRAQNLGEALSAYKDVPVPVPALALLNNVQSTSTLDTGFRLKVVRGTYHAAVQP
jgi:predicted Zn-dependent protease